MHEPNTRAFNIENPFVRRDKSGYRPSLLTIWHKDPDLHGDDDSCGWFIRSRHLDKEMLDKVIKDFTFEFKSLFDERGNPTTDSKLSLGLSLYVRALWTMLLHMYPKNYDKAGRIRDRFMRKHTWEILHFCDNPSHCLFLYRLPIKPEKMEYTVRDFAEIITADIARKLRPWYKHPRWHVRHWSIQFHPIQDLKRRYWDKCSICGKRGFKGPAMSDWYGTRRWHMECDNSIKQPQPDLT